MLHQRLVTEVPLPSDPCHEPLDRLCALQIREWSHWLRCLEVSLEFCLKVAVGVKDVRKVDGNQRIDISEERARTLSTSLFTASSGPTNGSRSLPPHSSNEAAPSPTTNAPPEAEWKATCWPIKVAAFRSGSTPLSRLCRQRLGVLNQSATPALTAAKSGYGAGVAR